MHLFKDYILVVDILKMCGFWVELNSVLTGIRPFEHMVILSVFALLDMEFV